MFLTCLHCVSFGPALSGQFLHAVFVCESKSPLIFAYGSVSITPLQGIHST